MISALLLAVATLSTPAAGQSPAYGSDTARALKGHGALPAGATELKSAKGPAACHPDPAKGRICRHHIAQAEQDGTNAPALAEAPAVATTPVAKAGEAWQ